MKGVYFGSQFKGTEEIMVARVKVAGLILPKAEHIFKKLWHSAYFLFFFLYCLEP